MAALTALMTHSCAGEYSWLARSSNSTSEPGTSKAKNNSGRPQHNKHKRHNNNDNTEDIAVNSGFSGSKSGQRKKPFKRNREGLSSLDQILGRPCQIHGTSDNPTNHTNQSCWVFKQASKLNTEHKEKGSPSEDDKEEPRQPNTRG